jgi:alpha-tubulin suppressor-like RCC1 family protein
LDWQASHFAIIVFSLISHSQNAYSRPVPLDIPNVIFTCIAAGSYHSVAIDHLNRVWTWGWGAFGQLGAGSVENVHYPTLINIEVI